MEEPRARQNVQRDVGVAEDRRDEEGPAKGDAQFAAEKGYAATDRCAIFKP